jgi:Mn-containing catalase
MSQGDDALAQPMRGSWNQGDQWEYITDRDQQVAVDGGTGIGSVQLKPVELEAVGQMAARIPSNPGANPMTGADLGTAAPSAVDDPEALALAKLQKVVNLLQT